MTASLSSHSFGIPPGRLLPPYLLPPTFSNLRVLLSFYRFMDSDGGSLASRRGAGGRGRRGLALFELPDSPPPPRPAPTTRWRLGGRLSKFPPRARAFPAKQRRCGGEKGKGGREYFQIRSNGGERERRGGAAARRLNTIDGNGLPSALSLVFYSHNIFFETVMKNWKG